MPWPFDCWHYHDEYELHCINRSRGDAFVGDHIGRFEPGYVALVGARLPHLDLATTCRPRASPHRSMVIHFRDDTAGRGMGVTCSPSSRRCCRCSTAPGSASSSSASASWCASASRASRGRKAWRGCAAFIGLLHELANWADWRQISSSAEPAGEDPSANTRMRRVLDHLELHLAEELCWPAVCAVANMAESSFSRYFHKHMGCTFTDFVTRLRITRACADAADLGPAGERHLLGGGLLELANFNRRFLQLERHDALGLQAAGAGPLRTVHGAEHAGGHHGLIGGLVRMGARSLRLDL